MDRKNFLSCLLALVLTLTVSGVSAQLISEFEPNPPSTDPPTVSFEISGTPGDSYSGFVLSIESDSGSGPGLVDEVEPISGTFDGNGLITVTINDFENPSFTVVLVDTFSGTVNVTDIDTNDDGVADDLSTFGTVRDAIGCPDTIGDEAYLYGTQLGGNDFAYTGDEPMIIFRDYSTGQFWAVNDPHNDLVFDTAGISYNPSAFIFGDPLVTSFGAINPSTVIPVELMSFSVE